MHIYLKQEEKTINHVERVVTSTCQTYNWLNYNKLKVFIIKKKRNTIYYHF
jgi:hypothetical protein